MVQAVIGMLLLASSPLLMIGVAVVESRRRRRPESAERWFEREVLRVAPEVDLMGPLPGLELEYDYRLGLKQRPAPVVAPPVRTRLAALSQPYCSEALGVWQIMPGERVLNRKNVGHLCICGHVDLEHEYGPSGGICRCSCAQFRPLRMVLGEASEYPRVGYADTAESLVLNGSSE